MTLHFALTYPYPDPPADPTYVEGYPCEGPVTQLFNRPSVAGGLHGGLDIAPPAGTPIIAPADGVIQGIYQASQGYDFGNWLALYHPDAGLYSAYAHMNATPLGSKGQAITRGTVLGYIGSTGIATGPHLHWAVSTNPLFPKNFSELTDPLAYVSDDPEDDNMPDPAAIARIDRIERILAINDGLDVTSTEQAVSDILQSIVGYPVPIGTSAHLTGDQCMQYLDKVGMNFYKGLGLTQKAIADHIAGH